MNFHTLPVRSVGKPHPNFRFSAKSAGRGSALAIPPMPTLGELTKWALMCHSRSFVGCCGVPVPSGSYWR
ncbi:MAG: hypothetical protein Q8O31_00320 [Rhodocyclaceae bacterium]|nr:hypothetical protein [Rhodocyclaceae bacterium]